MLTVEILEHTLQFLGRADLKGNEVPAFVAVNNALQDQLRTARVLAAQPPTAPDPE